MALLTAEYDEPIFTPPGENQVFDTLDNIELGSKDNIEELHARMSTTMKNAVGVVVCGENDSPISPHNNYWGRSLVLPNGEHLQVRIYPRNTFDKQIADNETRFVLIRRTSKHGQNSVASVGLGIFYLPRVSVADERSSAAANGSSIGCRAVHILLPSIFSLHDAQRDTSVGHANVDVEGFHCIRPSTVCIPTRLGEFKIAPGYGWLAIAGHMGGTDVCDTIEASTNVVAETFHDKEIEQRQQRIVKSIGQQKTEACMSSALVLCELLSAESVLGLMCNSCFAGALPGALVMPFGIPLTIAMAVYIACYPKRFNLSPGTEQDKFANKEMIRAFHSRWQTLQEDARAFDIAIKFSYTNAVKEAEAQNLSKELHDNLAFWKHVGQRVVTKLMSDPSDEIGEDYTSVSNNKFGLAEFVIDPVSDFKYATFGKKGYFAKVCDTPGKIFTAPRSDMKTAFYSVQDTIEIWLRTGMFGPRRMSKPNVPKFSSGCKSKSGDDSNGDTAFCINAMESAAQAMTTSMLFGAFSMHQYNIKCYLFADGCTHKCADCNENVDVLQGTLFDSQASACEQCNRRRCFKCARRRIEMKQSPNEHCLRCAPGATRDYNSLAQQTRATKKQEKRGSHKK